jgi:cell division protein FtsL
MATLANIFSRFSATDALVADAPVSVVTEALDDFKLRALPNEDVYFYFKKIDNAKVVREADPTARARSWKFLGAATLSVIGLIGMLLPSAYGLMASYQLHNLQVEHQSLVTEYSKLELEEAALLSPERLQVLAAEQKFVDPTPERVIYLDKKNDASLAMNRH